MLIEQGRDVLRASDDHALWSDVELLDLAVRERVLVTEDRDFSELVYRHEAIAPPGIVYLRYGPLTQPELADRVALVLANTKIDGHMVVIQRTGVRYRPLPRKTG